MQFCLFDAFGIFLFPFYRDILAEFILILILILVFVYRYNFSAFRFKGNISHFCLILVFQIMLRPIFYLISTNRNVFIVSILVNKNNLPHIVQFSGLVKKQDFRQA